MCENVEKTYLIHGKSKSIYVGKDGDRETQKEKKQDCIHGRNMIIYEQVRVSRFCVVRDLQIALSNLVRVLIVLIGELQENLRYFGKRSLLVLSYQ